MHVHQVSTLLLEFASPEIVPSARAQCACATRHIEAVVVLDAEVSREEVVGCFLQSTVRARDHQHVRALRVPGYAAGHGAGFVGRHGLVHQSS